MIFRKFIYSFILLLLFTPLAYSQSLPKTKVSLKWGKEHPSTSTIWGLNVIGKDNDNFFTLDGGYIEKYDGQLTVIKRQKLEFDDKKGRREIEALFINKRKKLFMLSSLKDKKLEINTVFVDSLDKNSLKSINGKEKIAEISYIERDYHRSVPERIMNKKRVEGNCVFVRSEDSSKNALILLSILDFTKHDKEKFSITVFDDDMKPLWYKSVALPYEDEFFEVSTVKISNEGDIYMIVKIYNEKSKKSDKGKPNFKYQIMRYKKALDNPEVLDVETGDKFIKKMSGTFDSTGNLILNGYYSFKNEDYASGFLFMNLDTKSFSIKMQNFTKFNFIKKEQIAEMKKPKKKVEEDKDPEYPSMILKEVIKRNDGNLLLVGESTTEAKFLDGRSTRTYIYYEDIYLISINSKGEIIWSETISKHQITTGGGDGFMSFGLIVNDKIHFIFNDDVDNAKKNRFATKATFDPYTGERNSALVMVSFDDNGKHSEVTLFNGKEKDTRAYPRYLFQDTPTEGILIGKLGSDKKLARIKFIGE